MHDSFGLDHSISPVEALTRKYYVAAMHPNFQKLAAGERNGSTAGAPGLDVPSQSIVLLCPVCLNLHAVKTTCVIFYAVDRKLESQRKHSMLDHVDDYIV